jgi:hypothetical protein
VVVILLDRLVHLEAGSVVEVVGGGVVIHDLVGVGQLLAVLVHQVLDDILGNLGLYSQPFFCYVAYRLVR